MRGQARQRLRGVANLASLTNLSGMLSRAHSSSSPASRVDVGPYPIVYVQSPSSVRAVLDGSAAGISERGRFFDDISRVIGRTSLVTCQGEQHRRLRRLLSPAFRPEQVAMYSATMLDATQEMLSRWVPGADVDLGAAMGQLTLDIAARSLLGLEGARQMQDFSAILETGTKIFYRLALPRPVSDRLWDSRLSPANRRLFAARARVDALVEEIIASRAAQATRVSSRPANLLDVLLAGSDPDGAALTSEEIRDQIVTFLFAGHETTAQALTWAFVLLGTHPEVEGHLQEELDALGTDHRLEASDAARLPYARAVFREALRLYPPAWFLSREAVEDTEIEGCPVPRGSLVLTSALAAHRDPNRWRHPEQFDPARWLGEDTERAGSEAYLPFGYGRRNCIGSVFATVESVLVLAAVASRWRLRIVEPDRVRVRATTTLRPRRPVHATIERRSTS